MKRSILIAAVLTLITSVVYGLGHQIDYSTAMIMAIGSLYGVYLGSRLTVRLSESALKAMITMVALTAGVSMLL